MALDKNKILSELGSVVNQLQSADCGCMGKLFNQGGGGGGMGGHGCCHGGGCHHGGHRCCSGEPMAQPSYGGMHGGHCMGSCNPPKLYADTYSYLSNNLMKPTIQEVYNDLKSITPANTVPNHPMASQIIGQGNPNMGQGMAGEGAGEAQQQYNMTMGAGGMTNASLSGSPDHQTGGMAAMGAMGGMGPDIMKMMESAGKQGQSPGQMNAMGAGGQMSTPMGMAGAQAVQGQQATMDSSRMPPNTGSNYGQPETPEMGFTPMPGLGRNYTAQKVSQLNPNQTMANNQGMGAPQTQHQNMPSAQYGIHAKGMAKFNEMFPGVNIPGDLGFDPMAMAIQMDPKNQQTATMNAVKEAMMGTPMHKTSKQPNLTMPNLSAGGAPVDPNQSTAYQQQPQAGGQQMQLQGTSPQIMPAQTISQATPPQTYMQPTPQPTQQMPPQGYVQQTPVQPTQQTMPVQGTNQQTMPVQQTHHMAYQGTSPQMQYQTGGIPSQVTEQAGNMGQPTQQVYAMQQGQNVAPQQMMQPPPVLDGPTGQVPVAASVPPGTQPAQMPQQVYAAAGQPNYVPTGHGKVQVVNAVPILPAETTPGATPGYILEQANPMSTHQPQMHQQQLQHMNQQQFNQQLPNQPIKEAILPVDTRNTGVEYNTLGQPVQMMPSDIYRVDEKLLNRLPQTLSPQGEFPRKVYSNVKNTMSKTSLMGNRPISRQTSRSQLQHIYHQYKGSKSYTQQNISPGGPPSNSGGNTQYIPIERQGGDSLPPAAAVPGAVLAEKDLENANANVSPAGDIPIPPSNFLPSKDAKKCRNGLQDQVFTSYPTSSAWSFHGVDKCCTRSGKFN